jgi:Dihydrodipicolinate synthetase family
MREVKGVIPILHIEYTGDDSINLTSLEREIDWIYHVGVDGCAIALATDTLRLTRPERLALIDVVAQLNAGRGSIVTSVSDRTTAEAKEYGRAAERAHYDAIMSTPPLAGGAVEQHFFQLADEIDLPLIVQDASAYVGDPMTIEFQASLLERYGPEKILYKPERAVPRASSTDREAPTSSIPSGAGSPASCLGAISSTPLCRSGARSSGATTKSPIVFIFGSSPCW